MSSSATRGNPLRVPLPPGGVEAAGGTCEDDVPQQIVFSDRRAARSGRAGGVRMSFTRLSVRRIGMLRPSTASLLTALLAGLLSLSGCGLFGSDSPTPQSALGDDSWYNAPMFRPVFGDFGETDARESMDPDERRVLLERGRYLTRGAAGCGSCHGAKAAQPDSTLAGGRQMQDRFGVVTAPNITPDRETGIGSWTVGQVIRAVRAGIDREGRPLSIDLHRTYRWLSDRDARSIALYLSSLKPVHNEIERRRLGGFERNRWGIISQHKEFEGYVPALNEGNRVQYGRYLAYHVSGCFGCHTAEGGVLENAPAFGGAEGEDESIVDSLGRLVALFEPQSDEEKRAAAASSLDGVITDESRDRLARAGGADPELLKRKRKTGPNGEAPEHDAALEEGKFPVGGPDIRGSAEDGLLTWTVPQMVRYLESGLKPDGERTDGRLCPWPFFKEMTARDREAIARFLKTQ